MTRPCGCKRAGQLGALRRSRRRKAGAHTLVAGVCAELPPGLRIDEPQDARVRELLLARVPDLDRDHVVSAGELQ